MIRRDVKLPGQSDQWMLFPQVHHAIFAWLIAEGWRSELFAPIEPHSEVMDAISGHDNGWQKWDEAPQLDPVHGRPLAFNEMPTAESLNIWSRSIRAGLDTGPLVAYAIAGHFTRLLNQFNTWRRSESTRGIGEQFLEYNTQHMKLWLRQWQAEDPHWHTVEVANRAVEFVRMFDALSLWLLCAERREPAKFATLDGPELTITPIKPDDMLVEPWPFAIAPYPLKATGRLFPQKRYNSTEELLAVPHAEATLEWTLRPR